VSVDRGTDQGLRLRYCLDADPEQLRLPPPISDPGRTDELWRHTCFEVFVAGHRSMAYREFNFSPSGQWAAYVFTDYRAGMLPLELHRAPALRWQRTAARLELIATLPADALMTDQTALRIALSAVIEEQSGTITYWALKHPAGQPDFHHPGSFALEF